MGLRRLHMACPKPLASSCRSPRGGSSVGSAALPPSPLLIGMFCLSLVLPGAVGFLMEVDAKTCGRSGYQVASRMQCQMYAANQGKVMYSVSYTDHDKGCYVTNDCTKYANNTCGIIGNGTVMYSSKSQFFYLDSCDTFSPCMCDAMKLPPAKPDAPENVEVISQNSGDTCGAAIDESACQQYANSLGISFFYPYVGETRGCVFTAGVLTYSAQGNLSACGSPGGVDCVCQRVTPAPPTLPPPTPAPPTPAPGTPAPATPAPPTSTPPTLSPDTPAPPTAPPATSQPATQAAPTNQPPPSPLPTQPPPVEISLTAAPALSGGGTAAPATPVPACVPRCAAAEPPLAPVAAAEVRGAAGHTVRIDAAYGLQGAAGALPFLLRSEGAGGAEAAFPPGSVPVVTLTTDRDDGLLSAVLRSGSQGGLQVQASGGAVVVTLSHPDYALASPDAETVRVAVGAVVLTPAAAAAAPVCGSACEASVRIAGESPRLAQAEQQQQQRNAASAGAAVGALVMPGQGNTGAKLGVLAFVSTAMQCPGDGPEELDRTLNPLGLRLGGDSFGEYNGALVGSVIVAAALVLYCTIAMWAVRHNLCGESNSQVRSREYLLTRARFGWLLVPFSFIYGGASVGAVTAVLYSETLYRLLGFAVFVILMVGLPVYVYFVQRRSLTLARCVPLQGRGRWVVRLFWGEHEWVADGPHSKQWVALHHLVFDAYRDGCRGFMLQELVYLALLATATAVQPRSREFCVGRAIGMTVLVAGFTLLLLVRRPYLALYDNILEPLIAGLETAMLAVTAAALQSDKPGEHWGAAAAGHVGIAVVWLVILKFAIDTAVFVIDEHTTWRLNGGRGGVCGFALYWFFFVNNQSDPDDCLDKSRGMLENEMTWRGDCSDASEGIGGGADDSPYGRGGIVDPDSDEDEDEDDACGGGDGGVVQCTKRPVLLGQQFSPEGSPQSASTDLTHRRLCEVRSPMSDSSDILRLACGMDTPMLTPLGAGRSRSSRYSIIAAPPLATPLRSERPQSPVFGSLLVQTVTPQTPVSRNIYGSTLTDTDRGTLLSNPSGSSTALLL